MSIWKTLVLGAGGLIVAGGTALAEPPPPAAPPPAPGKKAEKPAERVTDKPEFKEAVWRTIAATAPAIDQCTARYTDEFPENKGTITVMIDLGADGRVLKATTKTSLQAAQNLDSCLRDVAKSWKFPPIGASKVSTGIPIPVAAGQKFNLLKPGEKPAEQKAESGPAKDPDEWFNFDTTPSWTPEGEEQ